MEIQFESEVALPMPVFEGILRFEAQ